MDSVRISVAGDLSTSFQSSSTPTSQASALVSASSNTSITSTAPSLTTRIPSSIPIAPSAISSHPNWSSEPGTSYIVASNSSAEGMRLMGGKESSHISSSLSGVPEPYTSPGVSQPTPVSAMTGHATATALSQHAAPYLTSSNSISASRATPALDGSSISESITPTIPSISSASFSTAANISQNATFHSRSRSHPEVSHTVVDMAVLSHNDIISRPGTLQTAATIHTVTTTFRSTLASRSGAVRSEQVVDVTQTSTRAVIATAEFMTNPHLPVQVTGIVATESKHGSNTLLVIVLVPVLVTFLVLLPCSIFVLRWRRDRRLRSRADYNFAENQPNSQCGPRRPFVDSVVTTREEHQYDMCSVPSASMVHTNLLRGGGRVSDSQSGNIPARDPFSDNPEDDARVPLFIETNVPREVPDQNGAIPSPASSRASSRWASFSPTASFTESLHRIRSRLSTRSSNHHDAASRSRQRTPVDPLAPILFADKSQIRPSEDPFSDADWDHMDDPFANLSARSEGYDGRADHGKESSRHGYTALLRKMGRGS